MQKLDAKSAAAGLLARDHRTLAKTLRGVDERAPWLPELFRTMHQTVQERAQTAHVIGITGSPGAGKSTVVNALIAAYRDQGKRVGVIAVDPSSPFTGGAILGDRIRMREHTLDKDVFIRSLATRGALGGLSRSAADSVQVLVAGGFDIVLLETVGVGQDEVDVFKVAQSVVVVLTPGMGDDVQAIKAGILEIADVYLVNKADREGAHRMVSDLTAMLTLMPHPDDSTLPPVIEAVATERKGIGTLINSLANHRAWLRETDKGRARERHRIAESFRGLVRNELWSRVEKALGEEIENAALRVAAGEEGYALADALARNVLKV
jgi:LAO/AO transport system kinase